MTVLLAQPFSKYRKFLHKVLGTKAGERVYQLPVEKQYSEAECEAYYQRLCLGITQKHRGDKQAPLDTAFKARPVGVEEFVRDKFYLNMDAEIYPAVLPYLIEMNSGQYVEVVLTGGIGSAK